MNLSRADSLFQAHVQKPQKDRSAFIKLGVVAGLMVLAYVFALQQESKQIVAELLPTTLKSQLREELYKLVKNRLQQLAAHDLEPSITDQLPELVDERLDPTVENNLRAFLVASDARLEKMTTTERKQEIHNSITKALVSDNKALKSLLDDIVKKLRIPIADEKIVQEALVKEGSHAVVGELQRLAAMKSDLVRDVQLLHYTISVYSNNPNRLRLNV